MKTVLNLFFLISRLKAVCMALGSQMPVSLGGAVPAGEVDGIVPLLCTDPEAEDVSTAVQPHPSLSLHY